MVVKFRLDTPNLSYVRIPKQENSTFRYCGCSQEASNSDDTEQGSRIITAKILQNSDNLLSRILNALPELTPIVLGTPVVHDELERINQQMQYYQGEPDYSLPLIGSRSAIVSNCQQWNIPNANICYTSDEGDHSYSDYEVDGSDYENSAVSDEGVNSDSDYEVNRLDYENSAVDDVDFNQHTSNLLHSSNPTLAAADLSQLPYGSFQNTASINPDSSSRRFEDRTKRRIQRSFRNMIPPHISGPILLASNNMNSSRTSRGLQSSVNENMHGDTVEGLLVSNVILIRKK